MDNTEEKNQTKIKGQLKDKITITKGKNEQFQYVCGEMQGWRLHMEDSHICGYNNLGDGLSLFAVFDGHGGGHISYYLSECFIQLLKARLQSHKGDYVLALKSAFHFMDIKLLSPQAQEKMKQYKKINRPNENVFKYISNKPIPLAVQAGSTANMVLITKQKIYVANCGDSRSALYLGGEKNLSSPSGMSQRYVQLSSDHKPSNPLQKQRIEKAGDSVTNGRINGGLNVSRSLGDFFYKGKQLSQQQQSIIYLPQIRIFERPKMVHTQDNNACLNFMVIGCDGIWERFQKSSAGLLELVRCDLQLGLTLEQALKNLFNLLVRKDGQQTKGLGFDNMTAIIIKFLN